MRNIAIQRKISILAGGIIIVPGTEPSTAVTSTTLELELRKAGRQSPAIVDLKAALALIPGSSVEIISNTNSYAMKFLVLPAQDVDDCNCNNIDYYEILRGAARQASDEEKQAITSCSSIDDYTQLLGG